MLDETKKLFTKIMSLISRAVVDARGADGTYQVLWRGDRASADVDHMQPQGVHFRVPTEALGALLAPAGNLSASMLLCASGEAPSDALQPGEGGLHYLGVFKLFVAQDGTLHAGAYPATDFAAVASYVDARIAALQSAFDSHTHIYSPGPSPAAPTAPPATPLGPQATVASTKVRIEP